MALTPTTILTLSLLLLLPILSSTKVVEEEEFSEELLLKPLPDRKILAHFHFQTEAPISDHSFARHHHLFPKSIAQLVCVSVHFPLFSFIFIYFILVPIIVLTFQFYKL
jgi:phosphatidylinositol glycan class T